MKYAPIVIEPQPARTLPKSNEAFFVWLDGSNMPVTVRFHRIGFRRTWDHSAVQEHEIIAWASIPEIRVGAGEVPSKDFLGGPRSGGHSP